MELIEPPRLAHPRAAFEDVEDVIEDEQRLAERLGVDALGHVVGRVNLAAENDRRGLARQHGHERRGRDQPRRLVVAPAEPGRDPPQRFPQARPQAVVHFKERHVVGGAAGNVVVVLDAVQVRRFFQQVGEGVVVAEGDEGADEVGAERRARDEHPPFAHRVHRHHGAEPTELRRPERPHVLARARHPEAVARQRAERQRHRQVEPAPLLPGLDGGDEARGQEQLREQAHQPALFRAGQEIGVRQPRALLGAQVGEQVLLEDLFAGRIVVGAGPAPGVVVGDEEKNFRALTRHGEDVVPARGAPGPGREPLPLDDHRGPRLLARLLPAGRRGFGRHRPAPLHFVGPPGKLFPQAGDELLHLALVGAVVAFARQAVRTGAADVLADFFDPRPERRPAGMHGGQVFRQFIHRG